MRWRSLAVLRDCRVTNTDFGVGKAGKVDRTGPLKKACFGLCGGISKIARGFARENSVSVPEL